MAVQGINALNTVAGAVPMPGATQAKSSVNFKDMLTDALNNVNSLEQESNKMTEDFIAGRTDNIHSVMIAGQKATIALQFVMEVRNKVMDAYQEIMRMQV